MVVVLHKRQIHLPKRPVVFERSFQSAFIPPCATVLNVESSRRYDKIPNSSMRVPAPAVQVVVAL